MRARVNLKSDPISLVILAHDGTESDYLESVEDGSIIDVACVVCRPEKAERPIDDTTRKHNPLDVFGQAFLAGDFCRIEVR